MSFTVVQREVNWHSQHSLPDWNNKCSYCAFSSVETWFTRQKVTAYRNIIN